MNRWLHIDLLSLNRLNDLVMLNDWTLLLDCDLLWLMDRLNVLNDTRFILLLLMVLYVILYSLMILLLLLLLLLLVLLLQGIVLTTNLVECCLNLRRRCDYRCCVQSNIIKRCYWRRTSRDNPNLSRRWLMMVENGAVR